MQGNTERLGYTFFSVVPFFGDEKVTVNQKVRELLSNSLLLTVILVLGCGSIRTRITVSKRELRSKSRTFWLTVTFSANNKGATKRNVHSSEVAGAINTSNEKEGYYKIL